jgi:hypothetical protein
VYIVAMRKIRAIVRAAAFLAAQGRSRDESRNSGKTHVPPPVGCHPDVLVHVGLQSAPGTLEHAERLPKAVTITEQPHAAPHDVLDDAGAGGFGV